MKLKQILFFVFFLICISVSIEATNNFVYYIIPGTNYYYLPLIYETQNIDSTGTYTIRIELSMRNTNDALDTKIVNSATITANITDPNGNNNIYTMTNTNASGLYTLNYNFASVGTYNIILFANNSYVGWTKTQQYIYVGKFPINAQIISDTRYRTGDTNAEIVLYVEDDDGNPITSGTSQVKMYYPNKTIYINWTNMTEHENGIYYYGFTAPSTQGKYSLMTNFTSGSNNDLDSSTFDVGGWADLIGTTTTTSSSSPGTGTAYGTVDKDFFDIYTNDMELSKIRNEVVPEGTEEFLFFVENNRKYYHSIEFSCTGTNSICDHVAFETTVVNLPPTDRFDNKITVDYSQLKKEKNYVLNVVAKSSEEETKQLTYFINTVEDDKWYQKLTYLYFGILPAIVIYLGLSLLLAILVRLPFKDKRLLKNILSIAVSMIVFVSLYILSPFQQI